MQDAHMHAKKKAACMLDDVLHCPWACMHGRVHCREGGMQPCSAEECAALQLCCTQALSAQIGKVAASKGSTHSLGCKVQGWGSSHAALWVAAAQAGKHHGSGIVHSRQLSRAAPFHCRKSVGEGSTR